MTNYDRTASAYGEPVDHTGIARRVRLTTAGPLFDTRDIVAGIVAALMTLDPLAAAAFWVPYH
jgi:hypothetical protein